MSVNKNSFKNFLCSGAGKFIMIALFYLLFFGIFLLMSDLMDRMPVIAFVYFGLFCYFGWNALNGIQPDIFLVMPIGGWVLYFVIKIVFSLFIGIFVAPFVISKKIAEHIQNEASLGD